MSAPEEGDWRKVKRLGRYLKGNKRAVYVFKNQPMPEKVVMCSDADFAGCKRTRKHVWRSGDVRRALPEDVRLEIATHRAFSWRGRVLRDSQSRMRGTGHAEPVQRPGDRGGGADQH